MSPEFAAVVAGEVCGYRLLGMLLRPGRPTDAEAKELAKTQTAALREPTGGPGKAQTSGSIDSQPKERTESTLSARPAEHLAVLRQRPKSADARRRDPQRRRPNVDGPHGDAHEFLAHAHVTRPASVALRDSTNET